MKVSFRVNGKEVVSFPLFLGKLKNSYLMRFKAFEYDSERTTIYPIYKQLFDIHPKAGELTVSIYGNERVLDIILTKRPPFLSIGVSKCKIEIGDDKCE